MNYLKTIIGLLLISQFTGCIILYPFYGITKRDPEPRAEQIDYLNSIGVDTFDVFSFNCDYKDSLSMRKYALNSYKLEHDGYASPVQFRIYDKKGNLATGWEQCFGNPVRTKYLEHCPPVVKSYMPINFDVSFESDLNLFDINSEQKKILLNKKGKYDYIIIIFWAKWAGKFNKDAFYNINDYIKKYPATTFKVLKLNTSPVCNI